jgi:hypothetical protein
VSHVGPFHGGRPNQAALITWRVVDCDNTARRATVTAADVRAARELGAVALGVPVGRVVVTAFTARQLEVLATIASLIQRKGWSPTIREISGALNLCQNGARDQVIALNRKGALTWRGVGPTGKPLPRTLAITTTGYEILSRHLGQAQTATVVVIPERRCLVCACSTFLDRCHGRTTVAREAA